MKAVVWAAACFVGLASATLADESPSPTSESGLDVVKPSGTGPKVWKVIADEGKYLNNIEFFQITGFLNPDQTKLYFQLHRDTVAFPLVIQMTANMIRSSYDNDRNLQLTTWEGYLRKQDYYGNDVDVRMFTFDFTRQVYAKINWDKFDPVNLIKVGLNFKPGQEYAALMRAEK